MEFWQRESCGINELLEIIALLRSPNGCPWDREQTHRSVRRDFIEETYEAVEAIDNEDTALLLEELGDVLLQVLFHTQIEAEQGNFTFDNVCDGVSRKLILRHPHVFGSVKADTSDEVVSNWNAIKAREKNQETCADTMKGISASLPALIRADKIQGKAAKVGFCWDSPEKALADLKDEVNELSQSMAQDSRDEIIHELGDVLFAAANLARHLDIDPEDALTKASNRFISRFAIAELIAKSRKVRLEDADAETLTCLWKEAKNKEA